METVIDVIIEEFDGLYSLYDQSGQAIEHDFESKKEAEQWAINNGYYVVDNFNYRK